VYRPVNVVSVGLVVGPEVHQCYVITITSLVARVAARDVGGPGEIDFPRVTPPCYDNSVGFTDCEPQSVLIMSGAIANQQDDELPNLLVAVPLRTHFHT